jgi:hypothetical protein
MHITMLSEEKRGIDVVEGRKKRGDTSEWATEKTLASRSLLDYAMASEKAV